MRDLELGAFHELEVVEAVDGGVLLDGHGQDLFVPTHLIPTAADVGSRIEVFVYCDHDGAPQATTRTPEATVGEMACLECVSVTSAGAYLAWGPPKDLYAPPAEQATPMVEGRRYVVAVCLDRKGERLIASSRLTRHFDADVGELRPDDEVDVLVYGHVDVGVQVVVDQRHRGLIHKTDVYRSLRIGSEHVGYVRKVRDDGRLDIALTRRGADAIDDARQVVLDALKAAGGTLPLHDRSTPEEIQRALGLSKKAFKRAIGGLYKARQIRLDDDGIASIS